MTRPCDDVHAFADGELDDEAHERFAHHLGGCDHCGRELEIILMLGALMDEVRKPQGQDLPAARSARGPRRRPRRRPLALAALGLTAMAAGVLVVALSGNRGPAPDGPSPVGDDTGLLVALAGGPYRQLDGRFAYPGLDRHRQLNNQRSGGPGTAAGGPVPPSLAIEEGLAKLEERGDLHGLGVAHLLLGNLERARAYFEQAPRSTAVLIDQATLALRQGRYREALALTDRALGQSPDQPQALWNRALALDGLRQSEQAAAAFDRAASRSPADGWTQEARQRAGRLRPVPSSGANQE
jgi:tetratricopeptide (TPR) repeat protein